MRSPEAVEAACKPAIVATLKIGKQRNGRFGTRTVASIPTIANGAGSVRRQAAG